MADSAEAKNAINALFAFADALSELKSTLRNIEKNTGDLRDMWRASQATGVPDVAEEPAPQQQQPPPAPTPAAAPSSGMDKMLMALIAPQLGLDAATMKGMSEEDVMALAVAKMSQKKPVEAPANPPPTTPPPATS
jgi:predicted component of type VI protein secretion system